MKKLKIACITIAVMVAINLIIWLAPKQWGIPDIEWLVWFCLAFLVYIAVLLTHRLKD